VISCLIGDMRLDFYFHHILLYPNQQVIGLLPPRPKGLGIKIGFN
jgi:hypothetical protein